VLSLEAKLQTFCIPNIPHHPHTHASLFVGTDHADMVEIITIQRISQSVLVAILIFDAVLDDDIRNVVDRFRDPLKLYLTHLDRLQQQAIE
jgi:hypothetical protein